MKNQRLISYFTSYKKSSTNKELNSLVEIANQFNISLDEVIEAFIKVNNYQPSKAQIGDIDKYTSFTSLGMVDWRETQID